VNPHSENLKKKFFSKKSCIEVYKKSLVREMSVRNTKKCVDGKAPRTVDSHATPV
jgi:hypothetical protein